MKKIFISSVLFFMSFWLFGQNNIEFLLNGQVITELQCADNPDVTKLKVRIPALPAEALKYDKVAIKMGLYHWSNGDLSTKYAMKEYTGSNLKEIVSSKKPVELLLFAGDNSDFYFEPGSRPYESKYYRSPLGPQNVCDFPRNTLHLQKTSIVVQVGFYNITKTKHQFDERTNTWEDVPYYGLAKVFLKGELPIKLKPFDNGWTDDQKRLTVQFIEPDKYKNKAWVDKVHKEIMYFDINMKPETDFPEYGVSFMFRYNDIKEVEADQLFQKMHKKLAKKGIDYTPVQFVVDVIESKAAKNATNNYKYDKPRWIKLITTAFSETVPDFNDLKIHNALSTGTPPKDARKLFKQEKLGNNTYYIFEVPSYKDSQRHFIILTQTGNYVYRIDCKGIDRRNEFTDEQVDVMKKALAGFEFLK